MGDGVELAMTSDPTNHGTPIALGVTFCFPFRTCRVARVRLMSHSLSTRPQSAKSSPITFNTSASPGFRRQRSTADGYN